MFSTDSLLAQNQKGDGGNRVHDLHAAVSAVPALKNMDEEYNVKHIPPNFENGINILGLSFKAIFLIEGIIIGILSFAGIFVLITKFFGVTDIGQAAGISLAFAAVLAFFGIRGLNDEPISTFLYNLLLFAKKRRTAYYNPRVKKEAVSFQEERENMDPASEAIPRERILALVNDLKEKHTDKVYIDDSFFNPEFMEFEDDKILEDRKSKVKKGRKGAENEDD